MRPTVRNARPEDAEFVKIFVKEHMVRNHPETPYAKLKEKAEADIEKHCAGPTSFVLELDGKVIGYLGVSVDTDKYTKQRVGVLHMIHVAEVYRGSGYSHLLMKKADEFFGNNHVDFREVSVDAGNEAAIGLYKKHGYRLWRCTFKRIERPEQIRRKSQPA